MWRSPRDVSFGAVSGVLNTARRLQRRRRHRVRSENAAAAAAVAASAAVVMHLYTAAAAAAGRTCTMTARADHSIRMYRRRPPGIKPVSSRWSHGLVHGLPPKPRRVVKAPARHNHRRGLSTRPTHTHTHTGSHLHLTDGHQHYFYTRHTVHTVAHDNDDNCK